MICRKCGAEYPDGGKFCPACGTAAVPPQPQQPTSQTYQPNSQPQQPTAQSVYYAPQPRSSAPTDPDTFFRYHPEYRPLGAWAYFGLSLLYSIPIVGFVFLIVHSFSRGNLVRRSYARSFWCGLMIAAIILVILLICGFSIFDQPGRGYYYY